MKLFDETRTYTYPNGLALYVLPRPGSASLELQCAVRTGSIHEGEHSGCGLSHFLEHMLFQGCAGFPGRSGSEKIEKTGGSINAYTSYDRTVYYLRVPEKAKELAVDLLSSMVRFPELPEKRFAEEKDVILRECDLYFDSPAIKMFLTGFDALFGTHPARGPIIGHRPMIASVTRDMAAAYHGNIQFVFHKVLHSFPVCAIIIAETFDFHNVFLFDMIFWIYIYIYIYFFFEGDENQG